MDRYKQNLCRENFDDCVNEEEILECIVKNEHGYNYEYHLNADGKLHSRYLEEFGCYEPAIIVRNQYVTFLYWLFNGEIKDCLHPFTISVDKKENNLYSIDYYSLERIQRQLPIYLYYHTNSKTTNASYNEFRYNDLIAAIISDIPSYSTCVAQPPHDKLDMSQYITISPYVICPLWSDEFDEGNGLFKFKFAD